MKETLILPLFITFFVVCGCSSKQKGTAPEAKIEQATKVALPDFSSISTSDVYAYSCADSLQFKVHVSRDSTWLFLADTTLKLNPVRSASGARYSSGSFLYWNKGNKALLQLAEGSLMQCEVNPREKAWAAADIRGVDFRALGQEPGWILEIFDDRQMIFAGNYGSDTVRTPVPKPKMDQQIKIYQAETDAHSLSVEISDEPCSDSMSGFKFPKTVLVTLDGKTYQGCGRSLR